MLLRIPLARLASGRVGLGLALALGVGLRALELLRNPSLWWDEASLALNIVQRSMVQLLGPLDHDQVAPPLFLAVEKALVTVFGSHELVLRAFPFLAGIVGLFLFASLSRMLLGAGLTRNLAVGYFAITDTLIYFSAAVKAYSVDVAAVLLVSICALRFLREPRGRTALGYALVGALAPWFSHPAAFALAGTSCVLGLCFFRERRATDRRRSLALLGASGACWLVSFGVLYAFVLRFQTGNQVLDGYWTTSFAPLPPTSLTDLRWYFTAFFAFFTAAFGENGARLFGLTSFVMLVGYGALARPDPGARGRRFELGLLLAPVVFTLLASSLHRYPFQGRLLLFLVPAAWIGVGAGLAYLWELLQGRAEWVCVGLALMLGGHPFLNVVNLVRTPRMKQEFRPMAEHLREERRPDDMLYLSRPSECGMRFYGLRLGLELEPLRVGTRDDPCGPEFYRDLAGLVGRGRVWFLFAFNHDGVERDVTGGVVMVRLDELGTRLDQLDVGGMRLCLYDFGPGRGPGSGD